MDRGLNSLASLSGEGTQTNPYQIKTIADLKSVRDDFTNYDKHFILVNNLTFTSGDYENNIVGWKPIGDYHHQFSGAFNGNSKTIHNLFINQLEADHIGLFGYLNGSITELRLENASITGHPLKFTNVGGLAGSNYGSIVNFSTSGIMTGTVVGGLVEFNAGSIIGSSASAKINGTALPGGLVGHNFGNIAASSASGSVNGIDDVGGLAGYNNGNITGSSASSTVTGRNQVGGLVGDNTFGSITNSSTSGNISGHSMVGGLVGNNFGNISTALVSGNVNGKSRVGGLAGFNTRSIINSLVSGTVNGTAVVGGLVGDNHKNITGSSFSGRVSGTYSVGSLIGFNSGYVKGSTSVGIVTNYGIPEETPFSGTGTKANPFQITNIADLQSLRNNLHYYDKHFTLLNDLTFKSNDYENSSTGWKPIGNFTYPFTGAFNGNSKTIHNLHINRTDNHYIGFFGYLYTNISNLKLENVSVYGNAFYTGSLAGSNFGSITTSSASGTVSGSYSTGGLVGSNFGNILDSSISGNVNGFSKVGGLVGDNRGNITDSSALVTVNASFDVGGLTGRNSGTITGSSVSGIVSGKRYIGGVSRTKFR